MPLQYVVHFWPSATAQWFRNFANTPHESCMLPSRTTHLPHRRLSQGSPAQEEAIAVVGAGSVMGEVPGESVVLDDVRMEPTATIPRHAKRLQQGPCPARPAAAPAAQLRQWLQPPHPLAPSCPSPPRSLFRRRRPPRRHSRHPRTCRPLRRVRRKRAARVPPAGSTRTGAPLQHGHPGRPRADRPGQGRRRAGWALPPRWRVAGGLWRWSSCADGGRWLLSSLARCCRRQRRCPPPPPPHKTAQRL